MAGYDFGLNNVGLNDIIQDEDMTYYTNYSQAELLISILKPAVKDRLFSNIENFDLSQLPKGKNERIRSLKLLAHHEALFIGLLERNMISDADRITLYASDPGRFHHCIKGIDRTTVKRGKLDHMFTSGHPGYFRRHNWSLEVLGGSGWKEYISSRTRHTSKTIDTFLSNIDVIRNPSDLRTILLQNVGILRRLTLAHIDNSVLNAKHVILFAPILKRRHKKFKMKRDVFEEFKSKALFEVMSGKSTKTKNFMRALKLFEDDYVDN